MLILSACGAPESKQDLPNIVLIFMDDMGYSDIGCFGAGAYLTPHIDGLAGGGMKFTNFHASTAVCSASRASLLTGCYPTRVDVHGAYFPGSNQGLNPEETTIAEMLKPLGYATAVFGKWHLGHHHPFLPLQQGFDEYFGLPYSNDMWPVDYDGVPVSEKENPTRASKANYPPLPLYQGNDPVREINTLEEQGELTTLYTEKAVDFIRRNREKPFFLYIPHTMVHVPIAVSAKFKGKSQQGLFGDVMMEVDWSVGQVKQALEDNGILDNTLIIFTSDNGPWLNYGNHAGSAGPLREGKGSMWEGGHREATFMYWQGHIPEGSTCSHLASTIDILPTIAAITGADLPALEIDGLNILPLMEGRDRVVREEFWCYYAGELRAVRKGDWKLYFPHTYRSYQDVEPGMDGFPGPYDHKQCGLELYNLEEDLSETRDVAAQHPDIVEELSRIGDRARHDLGDRLLEIKGAEVRPAGNIKELLP